MTEILDPRVETWVCEYCTEEYPSYSAMQRCESICAAGTD